MRSVSGRDDAWRRAAPALGAWASAAIGMVAAREFVAAPSGVWFGVSALAALIACALRGRAASALLAASLAACSAGWITFRTAEPDRLTITGGDRAIATVEGVIVDQPELGDATPGAFSSFVAIPLVTRFTLLADAIIDAAGERSIRGRFLVRLGEAAPGLRAGQRVRLSGFALPIRAASNPGQPDPRAWAAQRGVVGRLLASLRGNVERPSDVDGRRFWMRASAARAAARMRAAAADRLGLTSSWSGAGVSDDRGRAVLAALLLGDRDHAGLREVDAAMRRLGAAHLLSISGLHLGVLVLLGVVALRLVGTPMRLETVVIAALVLLYIALVPVRTPVVRAAIMALSFLAVEAMGRRHHPLTTLAWTGVVVMAWKPLDLWSPGHQLSFGVVAAILIFPPMIERRLHPLREPPDLLTVPRRAARWMEQALIVALCAWAVATPIVAHHFGIISALSVPASVLLFPLVAGILWVGAGIVFIAWLIPALAAALTIALAWVGEALAAIVVWMDRLPFSSFIIAPVSVWWTTAALVCAVWWLATGVAWDRLKYGCTLLTVVWLGGFHAAPALDRDTALRIDALDVDDGSCLLIRSGGETVMWDCGSRMLWLGERVIPRAVRALGAWPVDGVVLTHPDLDHYSAIPDVAAALGVGRLIVGDATMRAARERPDGPVAALIEAVSREGVRIETVRAGDAVVIGDVAMEIIHPVEGERWSKANDESLTALIDVETEDGVRRVLLTGDLEPRAMEALLERRPDLRADIIEAPHHGSARPRAIEFVQRIDPDVVIQSTGASRAHDERWDRVREGRAWLTTAVDGAATVVVRRDGAIERRGYLSGPKR